MMTSHASPRFDLDSRRAANVLAAHPYGTEASLDRDQAAPNSAKLGPSSADQAAAPTGNLVTDQADRPAGNLVTPAVTKLPKPDNG